MAKNSLRDKLEDDELDLSMMQYTEVPVREIEQLGGKVLKVNLSHNMLQMLPPTFPLLSQLTKLDLSKNQLVELPENFGQLKSLKSLDLYANQLERLPVSFAQLKSLKWLDLKDNPLCPALKQAAGDCITPGDCALAAKKVVALLQSMSSQLARERQRVLEEERRKREAQELLEAGEREKVRLEKRAAKEKRREENKAREEERKREQELKMRHEMQVGGGAGDGFKHNGNHHSQRENMNGVGGSVAGVESGRGGVRGCLGSLFLLLVGLGVLAAGVAVSLIWVYTEGRMDSKTVARALPVIQSDVEQYLLGLEAKARPYVDSCVASAGNAWKEGGKAIRSGAKYIEDNHGDTLASIRDSAAKGAGIVKSKIVQLWHIVLPYIMEAWEASKPFFHQLGKFIIERTLIVWEYLQANFPIYMEYLTEVSVSTYQFITKTFDKISEAF